MSSSYDIQSTDITREKNAVVGIPRKTKTKHKMLHRLHLYVGTSSKQGPNLSQNKKTITRCKHVVKKSNLHQDVLSFKNT